MARRVRTVMDVFDDFDGEMIPEGQGENLTFVWRGSEYEIDVSDEHAEQLDMLMQPVIKAARRVRRAPGLASGRKKPKTIEGDKTPEQSALPPPKNAGTNSEPIVMSAKAAMLSERAFRSRVRQWARENGFPDLGENGRLPAAVREAWNTAHPDRMVPPERHWEKGSQVKV